MVYIIITKDVLLIWNSSNINSLNGYHEMYNIIKPFYRNEKIKKLGI